MTEQEFNQTAAELSTRFNKTADEKMGEIRAALRQQPTTQKAKPVHTQSVFRRKPFLATIAASLTLILALGIILPIALQKGPDVPDNNWRQNAVQTVQNAQFTPNFEQIIYSYEAETAQVSTTTVTQIAETQSGSITPLSATFAEEKPLTLSFAATAAEEENLIRIDATQIESNSTIEQNWRERPIDAELNRSHIERRAETNKEIALYCMQNLSEQSVWQELPSAPTISATPGFKQQKLYAMFTLGENSAVDIRLFADGEIWDNTIWGEPFSTGKNASMKRRFVINPVHETVEMWMEQSEPFPYPNESSDYQYLCVEKDTALTVIGDTGIYIQTNEFFGGGHVYESMGIMEYRRIGEEYSAVITSFSYISDDGKKVFVEDETKDQFVVFTAKGSEQYTYIGRSSPENNWGMIYDPRERFGVFHANGEWEYYIQNIIGFDGNGIRIDEVNGRVGLRAVSGIQAYYVFPPPWSDFANKIELVDGTVLDYVEGFFLENQANNDVERLNMFHFYGVAGIGMPDDRIWGNLRFTRSYYGDEDWKFSDAFNSIPFPVGVGYVDDIDFTKVDNTEQVIKTAAVLGVENAYLYPERVMEKLNGLRVDMLSFSLPN